tara:strand:+ start:9341 stop:9718 length:378 start_codon:yes stop_codon:yes gene_type:complete
VQLATSREAKASGKSGPNDVFYSSTDYNFPVPKNLTKVILCSNPDGTGDTFVNDQISISVNGTLIYKHDYTHRNQGHITPLAPQSLIFSFHNYEGQSVTIETKYTDLYTNSNGASNFYLYIESNG